MEFKTWLLLTYDLASGRKSCLGVCSCPFKPNDRSPFYSSSRYHRQKWVEFSKSSDRKITINFNKEKLTVESVS